jgi:HK97 family phage major capsid protein
MKKYIMIDGVKHYIQKEEGTPAEVETPVETPVVEPEAPVEEPTAPTSEDIEATAKAIGKAVAKEVVAEMQLNQSKQEKEVSGTIAKILHGKDLTDKSALTADEKIVGFYHALVTNDKATCKALSEGTAADGGYLFPDEFRAELIKTLTGPFTMRSLVNVIPMRRDVMKIPLLESRPKVTWTAENETKSTTTAHFDERTLTARKLAAILYSSDELIEDSTELDVVKTIISLFGDAITDEEDRVILAGNGTTQPTGIVTAVTATTYATRTCNGNLDFSDIINTYYDLGQPYRNKAKWVVASANVRELRQLKDTNGQYIWQPSVKENEPDRMLGKAVYENDYVGEATILFGDFKRAYALGDRKKMTVKVTQDTETAFTKDQTAIRVVARIAGNVWDDRALVALISIP